MNNLPFDLTELKNSKDDLIKKIETEFPEIYAWLKSTGVDLFEIGHYAKSLAAISLVSLTMLTSAAATVPYTVPSVEKEREVLALNSDALPELTKDQQQAHDVWNKYYDEIRASSAKYKVDPKLIFATIMVESRGNPEAIRHEPAINDASYGLGQILYGTAVLMGYEGTPQQLKDPAVNIDMIARYHRYNLDTYGDLDVAHIATAYNAGNPYSTPTYGHVAKFTNWYNMINVLLVYEGKEV